MFSDATSPHQRPPKRQRRGGRSGSVKGLKRQRRGPGNAKLHGPDGNVGTVRWKRQGSEAATPHLRQRQTSKVEATRRKPVARRWKRRAATAQPDAEAPAKPRPQPMRRRGGEGPRAACVEATRKRLLRTTHRFGWRHPERRNVTSDCRRGSAETSRGCVRETRASRPRP